MWYFDDNKWNHNYTQRTDELVASPAMYDAWGGFGEAPRGIIQGRLHGNPFFDTVGMAWQDTTSQKRAENDGYRAEYESGKETFAFDEIFRDLHKVRPYVQGMYIVGTDEPEYVEHGEAYIHERLTSHLAEPGREPQEAWDPWLREPFRYVSAILVDNLAHGIVPPPLILEIERQRMGLPYEWVGAPID